MAVSAHHEAAAQQRVAASIGLGDQYPQPVGAIAQPVARRQRRRPARRVRPVEGAGDPSAIEPDANLAHPADHGETPFDFPGLAEMLGREAGRAGHLHAQRRHRAAPEPETHEAVLAAREDERPRLRHGPAATALGQDEEMIGPVAQAIATGEVRDAQRPTARAEAGSDVAPAHTHSQATGPGGHPDRDSHRQTRDERLRPRGHEHPPSNRCRRR
jgi:hypothetical protein